MIPKTGCDGDGFLERGHKSMLILTKQQARRFILAHQGLWPPCQLEGKDGILQYIRRVGCVQFDPLNIVGHNQDLVLQARVSGYRPLLLRELLYLDRQLLDGWDKNMSIYPVEDWPCFQRNREAARGYLGNAKRPATAILPQVRKEFEMRGPLSSADLDYNQKVNWAWAPTRLSRAVLESMYFWGELIIHHKERTRRVYDLASRHIPADLLAASDPNITEEQYHDWYMLRRIGAIGMLWNKSGDAWLGISDFKSKERTGALKRLLNMGAVFECNVEGIKMPLLMRTEDKPRLDNVLTAETLPWEATILAPLDNLLWDRQLIKELFDFDYRWEVYKPVTERTYGYYVLPVLYGGGFIARFEPGLDKKTDRLVIKNWWWEPGVRPSRRMKSDLARCFRRFAVYLEVNGIEAGEELLEQAGLEFLVTDYI